LYLGSGCVVLGLLAPPPKDNNETPRRQRLYTLASASGAVGRANGRNWPYDENVEILETIADAAAFADWVPQIVLTRLHRA
jgi:hypothetical protein